LSILFYCLSIILYCLLDKQSPLVSAVNSEGTTPVPDLMALYFMAQSEELIVFTERSEHLGCQRKANQFRP